MRIGAGANAQEITGDYVFLAGGCVPDIPSIDGLAGTPYLTSTEALRLKEHPKTMCVIGGGYIACELSHYFGALGVDVHMIVRSTILRQGVDRVINLMHTNFVFLRGLYFVCLFFVFLSGDFLWLSS